LIVGYKETTELENPKQCRCQTVLIIFESIDTTKNGQQALIASVVVLNKCHQYLLQHLQPFAYELGIVAAEREDIYSDFKQLFVKAERTSSIDE